MEGSTEEFVARRQKMGAFISRDSAWLTRRTPCVRNARMLRSVLFASARDPRASRPRIARRIGVAVALAATLGQLLATAHAETSRGIASHIASRLETAVATLGAATTHATPHDSTQCATCQAAAHARTALRSAPLARVTGSYAQVDLVFSDSEDLPGSLARSTVTPRAPPA
jgi:hypothetical protein